MAVTPIPMHNIKRKSPPLTRGRAAKKQKESVNSKKKYSAKKEEEKTIPDFTVNKDAKSGTMENGIPEKNFLMKQNLCMTLVYDACV